MAIQATLSDRLRSVADKTELERADFAELIGTNPRTVTRWFTQESEPRTEARRRLLEVLATLESLSDVLQPQAAHDWLFSPNPLIEHKKPIELLADGKWREVLGLVEALAEGIFV